MLFYLQIRYYIQDINIWMIHLDIMMGCTFYAMNSSAEFFDNLYRNI